MEGVGGRGGMNYEQGATRKGGGGGADEKVEAEIRRRAWQGTFWRPHHGGAPPKHTPCGSRTCGSGQWESQKQEALISNSVIWLC